jgi:hypothetical protein
MRRLRPPTITFAGLVAALTLALLLAGALVWFLPALTTKEQPTAGVPAPPALFALAEFAVPPHQEACMSSVTITPESGLALFRLRPAKAGKAGGPPVELVLSGSDYRSVAHVPGGYPGGSVTLPVTPPSRTLIGSACFVNRGTSTVLLDGTTEPRTVSRSPTVVGGTSVVGDVALTFLAAKPRTIFDRLGEVFTHASNLTEGLVPAWLVWIIAILAAVGIPAAAVAAFWLSLLSDEAATSASRPR